MEVKEVVRKTEKKNCGQKTVSTLLTKITKLQREALVLENTFEAQVQKVHPDLQESAKNLLHYLALRKQDNRDLQVDLSVLGLSSLGRAESHVMGSLTAIQNQLQVLEANYTGAPQPQVAFKPWNSILKRNLAALLGPGSEGREGRIMVTFSTEFATDYELVKSLLLAGMNCARINCAHDDKKVWKKMVENIKTAEQEVGRPCKILFDLMGPKLRTGSVSPGPEVLGIHPTFNELGEILSPAKVWLAPKGVGTQQLVTASLKISEEFVSQLQPGDEIRFQDARRRKRKFTVAEAQGGGALLHLQKSSFLRTGTEVCHFRDGQELQQERIGKVPSVSMPLLLQPGQTLVLHRDPKPGAPAKYDKDGNVLEPAHISCTLPEIFARVKAGEPILFDDGEIEGVIAEVQPEYLQIKITAAEDTGSKLKPDKGINLPESDLRLFTLTEKDNADLKFVVKHADIVNLSFVSHPEMVEELQRALASYKASHVGIMLKIETKAAFNNLPHLLLTLMRNHPAGIMIARGDLAVELGWKRLAEVQEEILWITEAAHLPVVWATQVLETLTKKGRPSRAEVTDAAMAQRADCVMLNKGRYILKSMDMLDDIMKRMQQHQYKKTPLLRMLHVSDLEASLGK
ncbi:pyruvate kinase [Rufibacter sp. LB8]|uniref:pyruvate kinase n=1 Tax=Rufibacter sp. LB8 TaxID=2777781 RepID=UPI00178C3928|nr:pyruvate kinase [Rufibacter sp. LB8]